MTFGSLLVVVVSLSKTGISKAGIGAVRNVRRAHACCAVPCARLCALYLYLPVLCTVLICAVAVRCRRVRACTGRAAASRAGRRALAQCMQRRHGCLRASPVDAHC
eukprot:6181828-Pleurochrysis_carterae.AAC.1